MEKRRLNRAERVIQFLEQHYPGWVEATRLEPIGGRCAWRTAVSEARTLVAVLGWDIENRQQRKGDPRFPYTLSEYRLKKRCESSPEADAVAAPVDSAHGSAIAHDVNSWDLR